MLLNVIFKFLIQIFFIVTCYLTVSICIIVASTLNDFSVSSLSSETKAQLLTRLSVAGCYQNKYLCMRSLRQDFVLRFL